MVLPSYDACQVYQRSVCHDNPMGVVVTHIVGGKQQL